MSLWGSKNKKKSSWSNWTSNSREGENDTNFTKERKKGRTWGQRIEKILDAIVSIGLGLIKWVWRSLMRLLKALGSMVKDFSEICLSLIEPPGIWYLANGIAWALICANFATYYESLRIFFDRSGLPLVTSWDIDPGFLILAIIFTLIATIGQSIAFDKWSIESRGREAESLQRTLRPMEVDPNAHPLAQYVVKRYNRSGLSTIMRSTTVSLLVFAADGIFNIFPFWWHGIHVVPAILAGIFLAYLPEWLKNLAKEGLTSPKAEPKNQSWTSVDTSAASTSTAGGDDPW